MTSIFSPRRTKTSGKGATPERVPVPATLATAHAAAFVKAKRDGDLLVTTIFEEKKGKETERVEQILRFNMKMTGEQVRQKVIDEYQIKKSEKLVPYFPSGGVYLDLNRTIDQYVMGTTETMVLKPFTKPRGSLLVILYELGKVEQVDVWSKTTVLGVLMSIVAKTENTVNECILCTPEPVRELPLDLVLAKSPSKLSKSKLAFMRRNRVTDAQPPRPLFPSRQYLIDSFNAHFQSTMYIPPAASDPELAPEPTPAPTPAKPSALSTGRISSGAGSTSSDDRASTRKRSTANSTWTKGQVTPDLQSQASLPDLSSYMNVEAPTTPAAPKKYVVNLTSSADELAESAEPSEDAEASSPSPPLSPVAEQSPFTSSAVSPRSYDPAHDDEAATDVAPSVSAPLIAAPAIVDVKAEILADPARKYERLVEVLERDPIPEPRTVAALFKDWFTHDAAFKAYFNGLGAARVAEVFKHVAQALKG